MNTDLSQRFIFNRTDIRGDLVRLESSVTELFQNHQYPRPVRQLLSEALVAVVLMGSTIKFKGRLVLQARSKGPVTLLMAEVTDEQQIRGYAQFDSIDDNASDAIPDLLVGGTLAVTVEPEEGERYQSLVPVSSRTLGECLEHYFQQSEQLNTLIRLVAGPQSASGMLIQQLPPQLVTDKVRRNEDWTRLMLLGDTVSSKELLTLPPVEILNRLYHQEEVKLLQEKPVKFGCTCSEARMASALISLGEQELNELFDETPQLDLNCEICGVKRSFTKDRLIEISTAGHDLH